MLRVACQLFMLADRAERFFEGRLVGEIVRLARDLAVQEECSLWRMPNIACCMLHVACCMLHASRECLTYSTCNTRHTGIPNMRKIQHSNIQQQRTGMPNIHNMWHIQHMQHTALQGEGASELHPDDRSIKAAPAAIARACESGSRPSLRPPTAITASGCACTIIFTSERLQKSAPATGGLGREAHRKVLGKVMTRLK